MTRSILLVEDNTQNAYLATYLLERAGHRVVAAADGPTALERAAAEPPDVVLLDVQLPGMDGFAVLAALRALPALATTPVVAVTALALAGDRERILQAGFTGYIEKPIDPPSFVAAVDRFIAACARGDTRSIVIAADDAKSRYLLRVVLESGGFEVVEAADGTTALQLARARTPYAIVTDLLMPDMDGFRLIRECRKDPTLERVPIVVYTATYTTPADADLVMDLGATRFLVKPLEPKALLSALSDAVSGPPPAPREVTRRLLERQEEFEGRHGERIRAKLDSKVTELESTRGKLEELVTRYEAILDASTSAIISTDSARRVRSVNRAAEHLLGWSAAELTGTSVDLLIPNDEREASAKARQETIATGKPVRVVTRRLHKHGHAVDVEMTLTYLGADLGFFAILTDLTDTLRLGARLAQAEQRLALFLAKSPTVLYALDVRGAQVVPAWMSDNVRNLVGCAPADLVGQDWVDRRVVSEDRDAVRAAARALLERGRATCEYRITTVGGEVRWVLDEAIVARDVHGHAVEALGTLVDTTALRKADEEKHALQAQLASAQKLEAVGRLAGGVAHDFNNMLTVILSHGHFLLNDLPPDDVLREDARGIIEAGQRAASLTRQLLAFSRRQRAAPEVLDLREVVDGMAGMLRRLIGEDIALSVRAPEGLGRIEADRSQIEQVVMNLVVNARDAMPHGGRLAVSLADRTVAAGDVEGVAPGRWVVVTVTDTGIGMDEATRARAFEPFFTTKEQGKGTGLGLSVVYGIVQQSGGTIRLTSAPGQGTTFDLWLPCVARTSTAATPHGRTPAPTGKGEAVLLVEDEDLVRKVSKRVLADLGYRVIEASDPAQALQIAEQTAGAIDLLFTDVVMPGMSGRELALRLVQARPGLKVLFCSGYTEDHALLKAIATAGATVVEKPYQHDALAVAVRGVLDGALPGGVGGQG